MTNPDGIGIVGGSGQLGGAIARALLRSGYVTPDRLLVSNRSGKALGFDAWPGVRATTRNQDLADVCRTIVLSVPPHLAPGVAMDAKECLVISVMAGVTAARLGEITGSSRTVRAMSSPAAEIGLAYSPWFASPGVTPGDRQTVRGIFEACGTTDEVADEDQINLFTAMTGPVPGFVAYYAACMVDYAIKRGIDPAIADRAIRQLFLGSGTIMAESAASPADHVREMVDYAGTTAAGLLAMKDSPLAAAMEQGLDAACARSRTIG